MPCTIESIRASTQPGKIERLLGRGQGIDRSFEIVERTRRWIEHTFVSYRRDALNSRKSCELNEPAAVRFGDRFDAR